MLQLKQNILNYLNFLATSILLRKLLDFVVVVLIKIGLRILKYVRFCNKPQIPYWMKI